MHACACLYVHVCLCVCLCVCVFSQETERKLHGRHGPYWLVHRECAATVDRNTHQVQQFVWPLGTGDDWWMPSGVNAGSAESDQLFLVWPWCLCDVSWGCLCVSKAFQPILSFSNPVNFLPILFFVSHRTTRMAFCCLRESKKNNSVLPWVLDLHGYNCVILFIFIVSFYQ